MHTLYESEAFAVLHLSADPLPDDGYTSQRLESPHQATRLVREGFEIVDKYAGKEIFLDGSLAEVFQQQMEAWRITTPSQEEVEDTLAAYTSLAQTSMTVH